MEYKLSTALYGHYMDVRAVGVSPDGNIVSCSRDKTTKIWKPNGFNSGFTEFQTLEGHTNFVSSVCVLPATEACPKGIILTGSNDHNICAYNVDNVQPFIIFKGHSGTVCKLAPGSSPNTFLSASWDCSCKIWSLASPNEPLVTLTGHQMAIWSCLQLSSGFIVTASADKTINVYTNDHKLFKTLNGHTDCVRDLTAFGSDTEFLSCSNDATIRKWNVLTGECIDIWYGHPNYIYSICAFGDVVVSGGEDRLVKIWHSGKHYQLILPCQSIWAVTILQNKDIVTGSSDGVVRVFSACPDRQADETTIAKFNEEVTNLNSAVQQEIGGIKVSDLPGPEALYESGKSDGQTKLVREGGGVMCYSWSAATKLWSKVGDVLGAGNENNAQSSGGKTLFNGKEYDYVFNVDIEDGKPPIKLPYNSNEDPWHSAQNFIHKNNLSQYYLEQVANFIINNSKQPEASQVNNGSVQFCDPFTGGARYIPSATEDSKGVNTTSIANGSIKSDESSNEAKLFPQTSYVRFDQGNLKLILEKLEEFNKKVVNGVGVEELQSLVKLADLSSTPSEVDILTLKKLLNWSPDILFPVLDVLRLVIRNSEVNALLCGGNEGEVILNLLNRHLEPNALPANQMLATRTLSNMLAHPSGETLLIDNCEPLLDKLMSLTTTSLSPTKQLQIALATVLLNLGIVFINKKDESSQKIIVSLLNNILPTCTDPEAQLRALVALGTLLASSKTLIPLVDMIIIDILHQLALQKTDNYKVAVCSQQILSLLPK